MSSAASKKARKRWVGKDCSFDVFHSISCSSPWRQVDQFGALAQDVNPRISRIWGLNDFTIPSCSEAVTRGTPMKEFPDFDFPYLFLPLLRKAMEAASGRIEAVE